MSDWIEELERLTQLHKGGALSDEEFSVQKAQILGRTREASRVTDSHPDASRRGPTVNPTTVVVGLLSAAVLGLLMWAFVSSGIEPREEGPAKPQVASQQVQEPLPAATIQANAAPVFEGPPIELPTRPATTYNPSYRCTENQSNVLRMICTNRDLSEKDRQLSAMFKIVLQEIPAGNRPLLLAKQRRLLADRDMCGNIYCIERWYD